MNNSIIYRPLTATPFKRNSFYTEISPSKELQSYIRCYWGTENILIRSMEEMAPYFRSSAFSNQSTTYVVDSNGTKMFEDTAVEELRILAVILLLILASVLFVTKFRNSSHPLAKKIPILAMTANAFSEDVQNAFNAGMNAHIVKPVDMKVLIKTVRNLQTGAGAAGTLN